jgi:hypothetical protein
MSQELSDALRMLSLVGCDDLAEAVAEAAGEPCAKAHHGRVGECPYCRMAVLEALLAEAYEERERWSVGLCYRIGQYLNARASE